MSIAAVDTGRAALYSPFPTLSNLGHSDDPHGLNAFLLHPEDSLWAYLEPAPARRPREDGQIEQDDGSSAPPAQGLRKQKSVAFFRKSPLGQPPLDADVEQVTRSPVRKGLRSSWSFRKDVPDLPSTPRSSSSTNSVVSSVSSNDSDGAQTPQDDVVTDKAGIACAKLLDALSASQAKKYRSKSWIGWIGKKRKEDVLGQVMDELQAVEEPPTLAPALRITSRTGELEAIHYQLRSLSICKLAALKTPSPHPLADIFNQQIPFAPRRRSRTFPASTNRVRPLASLSPSQSGERIKLLVSLALRNAEAGLPVGVDRLPHSRVRQSTPARPAGLVAFLSRPAFEDRMVVYYPDRTSIVTPSNSNAVASIEFSPHLYALAEAGNLSIPITVTPVAGPVDEVEAQRVVEIAMTVAEDVALQVFKSVEQAEPVVAAAASLPPTDIADPPAKPSSPSSNPIERPHPQAGRVFRSSFVAKPVTHSWADSDSSESSEAGLSDDDEDEPLAYVAAKRQQAVVKPPLPPAPPTQSMVKEERREEERQRRYREEVERSRARRESARRGEVERKVGMDAAGRPSVPAQKPQQSQSRSPASRSRSSLPASNRPSSVHLPVPALPRPTRVRTSSYTLPYNQPTMADRRSQSFYEVPRAYAMPMYPVQPLLPSRAMSMVYPPYMAPTPFPIAPSQSRPSRRHSHLPIQ